MLNKDISILEIKKELENKGDFIGEVRAEKLEAVKMHISCRGTPADVPKRARNYSQLLEGRT